MKKSFVVVLIFLLGTLWAGGERESGPLTLSFPKTISSIPLLELIEEFPQEYEGVEFTDHGLGLASLVSQDVDVLATGYILGLKRALSAGDVAHFQTYVWGVASLVTKEPLVSLSQLSGGTLVLPFRDSPLDLQYRALLEKEGLTDQVEIQYAPFPQAAALLAQGQVQGAVLVEPIASRMVVSSQGYRLQTVTQGWADLTSGDPRSPQVSLFVLQEKRGDPALSLFLKRLRATVQNIRDNPQSYGEKYSEYFQLPSQVIVLALENTWIELLPGAEASHLIQSYGQFLQLGDLPQGFFLEF